jgi:type IV secretory pathway TraG/TraD family ATPase VirD4
MTVTRALAWFADPVVAAATLPGPGEGFDVAGFVACRNTLYMIGAGRDEAPIAPLFRAFAEYVHSQAAFVGSLMSHGRLDPPMLLALDEVTQICPVPLPLWMADSAGKGILIVAVCHGLAQLEARWDSAGARAIWDTAGIKVILGGVTDPDTLDRLSRLCGEIRLRTHSRTHDQYRGRGHTVSYEPVPVLPPDLLRTLPEWRALIVRGNLSPVIVRLRMAWKRRDYRHARQHNRAPHRPLPAAVEPPEEPAPVIGYGLILPPPQNGSPWHSQPGLQPVGADDELASQRDTRRPEAAPPWALPPGAHPPVPAPPGGGRRPPRPRRPWDPPADLGGQK